MRVKSKTRIALSFVMAMLLSGCGTTGVDSFCAVDRAIYIDRCKDVLSDETARQINDHNDIGAKHCGWKHHTGAPCPKTPNP